MLRAEQVVDSLHRIESRQRHLNEYGVPIAHGPIPESGQLQRLQLASVLALVADEKTECAAIEEVIYSACKAVTDIRLFDIYRSPAIGLDKKSMAFTVTFAPGETELMPDEADKYVAKILKALEYKLGIQLR